MERPNGVFLELSVTGKQCKKRKRGEFLFHMKRMSEQTQKPVIDSRRGAARERPQGWWTLEHCFGGKNRTAVNNQLEGEVKTHPKAGIILSSWLKIKSHQNGVTDNLFLFS